MSDSFFKGSLLAFSFCKDSRIQSRYIASDWRQHQNQQCQVCRACIVWKLALHALQRSGTKASHKKRKKMQTRTNFKTPNQRVWNVAQNSRSSASLGAAVGGKRSVHVCVGGCASSLRSQSRGSAFDGWAWHEHIYNGHVAAGRQQTRLPNDPGPKIWTVLIHFGVDKQTCAGTLPQIIHLSMIRWSVPTCVQKQDLLPSIYTNVQKCFCRWSLVIDR